MLARDVTLYVLARLGLVAVVTGALILFKVPLLPALAVGVVVALPASLFIFKGLRQRVAVGLDAHQAARRSERDKLRSELRGDEGPVTQA
ncbi:DUF4229 domain-containing protein [Lentzea sp. HUAS12]|uniref:DUF4229 domain-containing protein n=1 Tax=Lentzea sp. HUAS12 TaxID=2951806 RepID=UPI00209E6F48|nr:DUF4229 domain-containing protein [Lentzea sp. HUAS12]USX50545.1 DUF4229 domain-containing protein [Lentzea sp. HUAS12]